MKKIFIQLHLWLSIPFGIIIAIICSTGALLIFENEILELRYPERYFVESAGRTPQPVSQLVEKLQQHLPDTAKVTGVKMENEADRTYKFYIDGGEGDCFVDPYTGEVTAKDERSAFFRKVVRLHRFLMHEYQRGDTPWGKWAVGVSTIAFVFILVSGLVMWFPKNRKMLKRNLSIKLPVGKFRFWYDLHVAGGFYACVFLLLMALTGLTWSFPWYRTPFYTLFGADPAEMAKGRGHRQQQEKPELCYATWDKMVDEMQARYPEYNTISIRNNEITVNYKDYGNIYERDQFSFTPEDGTIVKTTLNADRTQYSILRNWVYCIHSGGWGGMASRIAYCIAALLGVVFVFTGYYFWIKKTFLKKK